MSEAEYVRWLNEHGERERLGAIDSVVDWWERQQAQGQGQGQASDEKVEEENERMMGLLKVVLERSKKGLDKEPL